MEYQHGEAVPSEPSAPPGNSPLVIIGVLGVVLLLVFGASLARFDARRIEGRPAAAAPAGSPVAGPPPPGSGSEPKRSPVYELGTNPLLVPGTRPEKVSCALPALGRAADVLQAFYRAGLHCLDAAWRPALDTAAEPFRPTELTLDLNPLSRCGDAPTEQEATAFYCSRDNTIYIPRERILADAGLIRAGHVGILAHEYGHHVQELSGIMRAFEKELGGTEEHSPEEEALVRRLELQANCFAGVFLAAATGRGDVSARLATAAVDALGGDDSPTHGSHLNQLTWARAGLEQGITSACNTWTAAEESVR
jgi:predicted metalloprotease